MADIRELSYPKKSHRKEVVLPQESPLLAEFFGIMMGDGGIGSRWQATITLNAEADKEYISHVQELVRRLFGFTPSVSPRKGRKAVVIRISSVTVIDFLASLGLPRGDKLKHGLQIPDWIWTNPLLLRPCVRGLVDTDGCLFIHRHMVAGKSYRNIGLCFCSHSPALIGQVMNAFEEFGIIPHSSNQGRSIYLYKASAVARYLEVFGTSNPRICSVYENFMGDVA